MELTDSESNSLVVLQPDDASVHKDELSASGDAAITKKNVADENNASKRLTISLWDIKWYPSKEVLSLCKRSSLYSELFGEPKVILKRCQKQVDQGDPVYVKKKVSRCLESDEEDNQVHVRKKALRIPESDDENGHEIESKGESSSYEEENQIHVRKKALRILESDDENEHENQSKEDSSSDDENEHENQSKGDSSSDEEEHQIHVRKKSLRVRKSNDENEHENQSKGDSSSDEEENQIHVRKKTLRVRKSDEEYELERESSVDSTSSKDSKDSIGSESTGYSTSDVDFMPDSETTVYSSSDVDFMPDSETTVYSSSDKDYGETESDSSENSVHNYAHLRYYEKKIKKKREEREALVKSLEKRTGDLCKMLVALKKNIKPIKRKKLLKIGLLSKGSRSRSRRLAKFSDSVNFDEKALYLRSLIKTQETKDGEHKRKQFLKEVEKNRKDRIKRSKRDLLMKAAELKVSKS